MKYQVILGQCDETTVENLINKFPETRRIFQQHQVNVTACLSQTIKEVANNHNIEKPDLCQQLFDNCVQHHPLESYEADTLLAMLEAHYQQPHLQALPELHRLARKIEVVHRLQPTVPHGITQAVKDLESQLTDHIKNECKHVLSRLVHDQAPQSDIPIVQMNHEHDKLRQQLKKVRELTGQYQVPAEACRSWKRLYEELKQLDFSLSEQMGIERDILFPRFQF